MFNTVGQALDLVNALKEKIRDVHKVEIVIAPPFTAIKSIYDSLGDVSVQLAGQDVFWEESGAYTGQISPMMLKEAGCKWVIVGHSERRQLFGETDETVNKKIKAAILIGGLKPIMCVGETLEERESGSTWDVLDRQIEQGLTGLTADQMEKIVMAYEPVWAIGTGKTAAPEQAEEAHGKIRERIAVLFDDTIAQKTRILYGGSVKPGNAGELFRQTNIDGGLIGGASLKSADFVGIISAGVAVG